MSEIPIPYHETVIMPDYTGIPLPENREVLNNREKSLGIHEAGHILMGHMLGYDAIAFSLIPTKDYNAVAVLPGEIELDPYSYQITAAAGMISHPTEKAAGFGGINQKGSDYFIVNEISKNSPSLNTEAALNEAGINLFANLKLWERIAQIISDKSIRKSSDPELIKRIIKAAKYEIEKGIVSEWKISKPDDHLTKITNESILVDLEPGSYVVISDNHPILVGVYIDDEDKKHIFCKKCRAENGHSEECIYNGSNIEPKGMIEVFNRRKI